MIKELLAEIRPLAIEMGMVQKLEPINVVLEEGNQAMKWIRTVSTGESVQSVLQRGIADMLKEEMTELKREVLLG